MRNRQADNDTESRDAEHHPGGASRTSSKIVRRLLQVVSVIMPVVGVLCLVLPFALGDDFDDFIEALNEFVMMEGPVPGSISKDLPDDLEPEQANVSAFDGGTTGTTGDAFEELNASNLRNGSELSDDGKFDIPTGAVPSPLFGAESFTQRMFREEELGTRTLDSDAVAQGLPLPRPKNARSGPGGEKLDGFLAQGIYPFPTREANTRILNPWLLDVESFLDRQLDEPPAEGRPPGEDWAHQRWEEFFPEVYLTTAQAGARENGGFRNQFQRHGYGVGEFGPSAPGQEGETGLYHNTVDTSDHSFDGTTAGISVRFHPSMPIQLPNALWTFDGTFPPKLLLVRYGEPILLRHYNALPIDPSANHGFGLHTLTTHEHNGHNPAESDGYTQAFFFPGQFYDYRWPLALAGHDSINTNASDDRAGTPDGAGGITRIPGDWKETMSTHWFHDHMLDFTAQNVYKGNTAMLNYYSALDRGNEALDDGVNLRLPSGTALDWGNRDYDINLLIFDKAWDASGQLFFNIFNLDGGFLGDRMLTNWLWNPYFDVRARRYRFRILNGSVARYMRLALVRQVRGSAGQFAGPPGSSVSYDRAPFYMIANDGNIMEHAVHFPHGITPSLAISERYDLIIDFSQYPPGTKLYFVNLLEHRNGKRPHEAVFLDDILNEEYKPEIEGDEWTKGDPCVGKFLEFRVHEYTGVDLSMDPAEFVSVLPNGQPGKKMIPLPEFTEEELETALHRKFEFGRSDGTDSDPWTIKTDNGKGLTMDPRRLSAAPTESRVEIWRLENGGGGWSHPVHIHFEEGVILKRGGKDPPEWEKWARKDVFRIGRLGDSGDSVEVAIRFREFLGSFMEHCHNTQHEDHAMLLRFDVENPGQVRVMPTPMPTWDGVTYVPSFALPTFRSGKNESEFLRGDSNRDNLRDISDPIFVLDFLFQDGAAPTCLAAADCNDDEQIDISDAITELLTLYGGGPDLPPPWLVPGIDPTPGLGCERIGPAPIDNPEVQE